MTNKTLAVGMAMVFGCAAFSAQPAFATEPVRIQIEPNTIVAPISKDFIGFGYETSALARPGFFSPSNTPLVQLYRTLSPHGLVRIGGNVSDHTRFVAEGTPAVRSEKETTIINQAVLDEFGGFLRATGWKAMWGLNLGTGSKEEAVEEAVAVHRALGERLHSFEIGNEVDLLPRFQSCENYYGAYTEYKAAIRKALPEAVFSGPDIASKTQWALDFAETDHEDIKLLTHHYYRTGAKRHEATIETLLAPDAAWKVKLHQLQQACADKGIRFRINEVNSFYGGGKPGVSDTFASALWCLDYMFLLAAYGCDGVNMETDVNQMAWVSHYSPIFRDAAGELSTRPQYYGMLAFSLAGKGNLLKLTMSETDLNLSAYATGSAGGPIWVTVINKDLSRPARIEISLPAGCSKAEGSRLIAPSIESHDRVTLAGKEVSADGTWSPGPAEKIAVTGQVASLDLTAGSAVLLRLF